jgi:hypothetical protein
MKWIITYYMRKEQEEEARYYYYCVLRWLSLREVSDQIQTFVGNR